MACIHKDEHVALRYVLLIPDNVQPSTAIVTDSLGLEAHFYGYVKHMKTTGNKLRQERILAEIIKADKAAMQKAKREKEQELARKAKEEMDRAHAEEEKRTKKAKLEEEEKSKVEDNKMHDLEKVFTGKGSATGSKRLFLEYRALSSSKDFKNVKIVFKEDNAYVWRMVFDILKFDLSKELKSDFEAIQKSHHTVPSHIHILK